jgi:hypothetical protein
MYQRCTTPAVNSGEQRVIAGTTLEQVRAWTPKTAQLSEPEQPTIRDDTAAGSRSGRPDGQGRLF